MVQPPSSEGSISTFNPSPPAEPAHDPCEALVKQKPKHLDREEEETVWSPMGWKIRLQIFWEAKGLETKYVKFQGEDPGPAQQPRTTPPHRN